MDCMTRAARRPELDPHTLIDRWIDVFNERDFDSCRAIAADVYVEHALAPFGQVEPGVVNGPRHLCETAEWLLAQFPDLRMTTLALVVEGNTAAVRVRSEGTHHGPLNGVIRPTGKRFDAQQSHWFRIEDGRLAEHWATRDDLGRAPIGSGPCEGVIVNLYPAAVIRSLVAEPVPVASSSTSAPIAPPEVVRAALLDFSERRPMT
jgi:hypothetical protein